MQIWKKAKGGGVHNPETSASLEQFISLMEFSHLPVQERSSPISSGQGSFKVLILFLCLWDTIKVTGREMPVSTSMSLALERA